MEVAIDLRGLNEGEGVVSHCRQCFLQHFWLHHEVGVEDEEELAAGDGQRVVDVAGLGAEAGEATDVSGAQFRGEVADIVRVAVVEDVGLVASPHGQRCSDGPADGAQVLTEDGDEHVDVNPAPVEEQRPGRRIVGDAQVNVAPRIVEMALRLVECIGRPFVVAGEHRPHAHEAEEYEDEFGRQHEQPREHVAAVVDLQKKGGVNDDTNGGQDRQGKDSRGISVAGRLSTFLHRRGL